MIQLQRATVVVEGSRPNWRHREEEEYLYQDPQDQDRESQSAQRRALARIKLDHFRRCACGTTILYGTVPEDENPDLASQGGAE